VEFDGGQDEDEEAESSGGAEVEGGDAKAESKSAIRSNSDDGSAPLLGDAEDALSQPLDDYESGVVVALEPEIPHPEPAVQELAVEAVPPPSRRRRPRCHVTFGNVQVQEYSLTLGDHPCADATGGYPISLDWAHAEAEEEYSLDWYEETRPDRLVLLTAEDRKFVIQDISGMDRPALESLEEQRLQSIERERIEQQQRRQARSEARKAARARPPIRRSARLASKARPQAAADAAAPPTLPLRRSARLANTARCSYKE
jgi:hypothetical protein